MGRRRRQLGFEVGDLVTCRYFDQQWVYRIAAIANGQAQLNRVLPRTGQVRYAALADLEATGNPGTHEVA